MALVESRRNTLKILTGVTFSNLLVNLSTFAVMAVAPLKMSVEEFASLSLASSSAMVISAVSDLGLNTTIVKKFSETKEGNFLDVLMCLKGILFFTGIVALMLSYFGTGSVRFWLVAFSAGVALNYWSGLRACEQAQQNYGAFTSSNFKFAFSRLAVGYLALFTRSWLLVIIAVYVVPPLFVAIFGLSKFIEKLRVPSREYIRNVLGYSKIVFISSVCFIAMPYLPQYYIHRRLATVDVATYGLIITCIAPVSLVAYSLRTMLLPKVCERDDFLMTKFGSRGFLARLTLALVMLCACIVGVGWGISAIYGQKYPGIFFGFTLFSILYLMTAVLGLFNMQLHAFNVPELEMKVNFFRLVSLLMFLFLWGRSLISVVTITSVTLFASEFILFCAVSKVRSLRVDVGGVQ